MKIVFGLKKGKIEIKLNKFNFSPGEAIDGTVELKLKKPINARELSIVMYGESRGYSSGLGVIGRDSRRASIQRIFEFKQPLDGEKEYPVTDQPVVYTFQIKIPVDVLRQKLPEGTLEAIKTASDVLTGTIRNTSWYLEAKLDIPKKADVKKRLQINLA